MVQAAAFWLIGDGLVARAEREEAEKGDESLPGYHPGTIKSPVKFIRPETILLSIIIIVDLVTLRSTPGIYIRFWDLKQPLITGDPDVILVVFQKTVGRDKEPVLIQGHPEETIVMIIIIALPVSTYQDGPIPALMYRPYMSPGEEGDHFCLITPRIILDQAAEAGNPQQVRCHQAEGFVPPCYRQLLLIKKTAEGVCLQTP